MIRETDSKSVLRRYVAAVQAGDESAVRELFAEYMDSLYASEVARRQASWTSLRLETES